MLNKTEDNNLDNNVPGANSLISSNLFESAKSSIATSLQNSAAGLSKLLTHTESAIYNKKGNIILYHIISYHIV